MVELLYRQIRSLFKVKEASAYPELNVGCFIVVNIAVVRSGEDGNHLRKAFVVPMVHLVPLDLGLMSSDKRNQVVPRKEILACFVTKSQKQATYP